MPANSERRYPALSDAVRHFLSHHWGRRSATSLATKLATSVQAHNKAALPALQITVGTSHQALSHWKQGRYPPNDPRVLGELRKLVGCACADPAGVPYPNAAIDEISRPTPVDDSEPVDKAGAAALRQAVRLSRATASSCDRVGTLGSDHSVTLSRVYVPRRVEAGLRARLSASSVTAVVGEAGYGKTALMWNLHRLAVQDGFMPFLIPATALLRGLERSDGEYAITIEVLFTALRAARRRRRRPVLLVDTLDLLAHSPDARMAVDEVLAFAPRLAVPVVVACRPIEAGWLGLRDDEDAVDGAVDPPIRTVTLAPFLTDHRGDEVAAAITAYTRACYPSDQHDAVAQVISQATIQGRALREVVSNPLTLRILFELYAPNLPDPDLDGLALYDRLWLWCVVTDHRDRATPVVETDLSRWVQRAALAMLEQGQISISLRELRAWIGAGTVQGRDVVELIRSRGLLVVRAKADLLWFFHQTQFEHAAARAVAACGPDAAEALAAFVAEDPHDLLYGEVAGQLLLLAGRHAGSGTPAAVAERLLGGWLDDRQHGLRVLGLRTYARFRLPSPALTAAGRAALADCDVRAGRDFLRLLPSITHPRAERWCGDLAAAWQRPELRLECVRTVIRLAVQHPNDAVELVAELKIFDWLRNQDKSLLRGHDHVYLLMLEALVAVDPDWCREQALGFWTRFVELGITGGLTDLLQFLGRRGLRGASDLAVIDGSLRALVTQDPTIELQRAYLTYLGVPESTDTIGAVFADQTSAELWRRIRMRRIGASILRLPAAAANQALDDALAVATGPGDLEMCTVIGSELLVAATAEPDLPFAPHVAARCRADLRRTGVARRFWVLALRNVDLDDDDVRALFAPDLTDALTWLSPTELGPVVVSAASAGVSSAFRALTWCFSAEGQAFVPDQGVDLTHLRKVLQFRAARTPALLSLLGADALLTRDARDLSGAVEKMSVADLREAAAQPTPASIRRAMIEENRPDLRRQGFKLWRLLVDRHADDTPLPDEIATALAVTRDAELINGLLSFAAAMIEHPTWTDIDATRLQTVLRAYIREGSEARRRNDHPAQTRRRLTNREELSRQILAGLLARVVPLAVDRKIRDELRADLESVVFDPDYDLSDPQQLQAFTPAMTALGWLPERLIALDRQEAIDTFLAFVRHIHARHPEPVKWKVTVATKWQFMVRLLVSAAGSGQRRALVEELLTLDHNLAGHALTTCITRSPHRPPWLYQLVDQLTGTAHSSVRATLYEYDREQSRRHWTPAHEYAERLSALAPEDRPQR